MNFNTDQLIATQKTNAEVFAGLSEKTFAGFEKLVELNMAATKAVITESVSSLQALAAAKDPQALVALQSSLAKPLTEKSTSYSRHLYEIASGTAAEFTKAFESTAAESQKNVASFLESSLKNAPAGSEAAVSAFKNAINVSNNVAESAQKAVKQAVQLVESNLNTISSASLKA